ncbi:MAG: hypothetical protein P4L54_07105 [Acidocella sp.]|nr:hypothetical protein [Acidocella sp.]
MEEPDEPPHCVAEPVQVKPVVGVVVVTKFESWLEVPLKAALVTLAA